MCAQHEEMLLLLLRLHSGLSCCPAVYSVCVSLRHSARRMCDERWMMGAVRMRLWARAPVCCE